jgi:hypothetical protein
VLVLCSIDETVSFHEALITMFSWLRSYGALFYYPWIFLGATFCAAYGLYALKSLATIERAHAARFIISGLVFVAGALVLEAASGVIASRGGEQTVAYAVSASIEDILEIIGAILYLNAAAIYLQAITATFDMRVAMRD